MATPAENLATSLEALKTIQEKGNVAINTSALSRVDRERLISNGFIKEVYKGWYMSVSPDETDGNTTSWYSNYWEFICEVLNEKYGENWAVTPEQSVLLHAGNYTIPAQLIIRSPDATNFETKLLHNTSLFHIKSELPATSQISKRNNIRVFDIPAALIYSSPSIFTSNPIDVRTVILLVKDASELLQLLLDGGHSKIAGRMVGAFRNIGQDRIADDILKTMEKVGYEVREIDPFENKISLQLSNRVRSPYENRIKLLWSQMREQAIKNFPSAPGIPKNKKIYLENVEKIYVTDAYHSLSIEKYKVTPELIERVKTGNWDAKENKEDRKQRDAMAARGYWEAFKAVESSISKILDGENSGKVVDKEHGDWYRELFGPSVTAGLLKASDLAGYRNHQVYIGQSKHVPLNKEAIRDAMSALFELLEKETEASVKAVLGHFIFVFIHPYMDGNGRMGRFIMNAMLASGGYPWTVIPVQQRAEYMQALEQASVKQNIEPFAKFLGDLVSQVLKGTPVATLDQSTI